MFKLNLAKRKIYLGIRTLVFLLAFIIVPIAMADSYLLTSVGGLANKDTGAKSPAGVTGLATIHDGSCVKIINNSAKDYFIPTKNPTDWNTFSTHLPTSVSIGSCAVCTAGACCNIPTGQFIAAGTSCRASTGICDPAEKCTGGATSAMTSDCPNNSLCGANQYWNGTSCVAGNCLTSGSCAAPTVNNANGSCNPYYTTQVCNGSSDLCIGTTTNNYCYGTSGQVWWSNVYQTGTTAIKCNASAANSCNGQQPQGDALSCNGAGTCNVTGAKVDVGAACGGGENSMCVNGACLNKCSNLNGGLYVGDAAPNGDGDGYADVLDPDCGGCGECTAGDCCNISTGCFLAANTVIGTCGYCTGASNTSVDQGSASDLGGQCTTGGNGTDTSCQSPNCAASGRACGYLTAASTCRTTAGVCDQAEMCTGAAFTCPEDVFLSGNSCNASTGICDPAEKCTGVSSLCPSDTLCATNQYWNGTTCAAGNCATTGSCAAPVANTANGSCNPYYTSQVCNGSASTCTGTTTNNYCYGTSGQVWWTNVYQTGSSVMRCNTTPTANSCNGQQPQGDAMYCNAAGSCSVTGAKVDVGAACGGGENSMCVNGACVNKCSNLNGGLYVGDAAPNGDGDGYADVLDPDCGGCGECTAGDCCNISTGCFLAANTVIGTCGYCTGASNTSVDQGSASDLGGQCTTGGNGTDTSCQTANCAASGRACGFITAASNTTCRSSADVCDGAEICTGGAYGCPTDVMCPSGQKWNGASCAAGNCATSGSCAAPVANNTNGSCNPYWTSQICNGSAATCTGTTTNNYCYGTSGQVWWTNVYQTGSGTIKCNATVTANSCNSQQPQGDAMYCNAAGSCSVTGAKVDVGAACGGGENSMCVNGACVNKCSNLNGGLFVGDTAPNGDGDGYADAQDSDCDGGNQCTSGDCCDIPNGKFITAGTSCRASAGICDPVEKCTGAATSAMTSDCPGNTLCATNQYWNGASCAAGNCATSGSCAAPVANNTNGSCNPYWTSQICNGSAATCTGTTTNNYCYGTSGQVWWTSVYQTGSGTIKCNATVTANSCNSQQPQGDAMYCNAAGSCSVTGAKVDVGAACGGGENSMCVNGACVNKCSNLNGGLFVGDTAPNGDGDGYADAQDSDCNGGSQCTSGDCCDIPNGKFTAANTPIGTCGKCTGAAKDSVNQTAAEDLGSQCANASATPCQTDNCSGTSRACGFITAASNTTCRISGGACDPLETCTGAAFTCPSDTLTGNTVPCYTGNCTTNLAYLTGTSGACTFISQDKKCSGSEAICTNGPTSGGVSCYVSSGNVWWAGSSQATSATIKCGNSADNACSSNTQKTNNTLGCNGAGTCNVSSAFTNNGGTCAGTEKYICVVNTGVCTDKCAGGFDEDTNGYTDGQDAACGGSQECTTGTCCTIATAKFEPITTKCLTGTLNTPASGSCSRVATDQYCTGTGGDCTGSTQARYEYASSAGQIWNGSTWPTATCAISSRVGANYSCSGETIQRSAYGCNASGAADLTTAEATCSSGTTYPGGAWTSTTCTGGENSMCVAGQSACVNKCSNLNGGLFTGNDDGDAYVADAVDPDCGAQCSSGDCCNIATGQWYAAGYCPGTCNVCSGTADNSTTQTSGQDTCGQCATGANGTATSCQSANCSGSSRACGYLTTASTCRTSLGTCDSAEVCTGSAFTCPTDTFTANTVVCSTATGLAKVCQTSGFKCTGTANTCTTAYTENAPTEGYIWDGSGWIAANASYYCGTAASPDRCDGQVQQKSTSGCNTSGSCSTTTYSGYYINSGSSCSGKENERCLAGNCPSFCGMGHIEDDDQDGTGGTDYNKDNRDGDCGGCHNMCSSSNYGCSSTTGCWTEDACSTTGHHYVAGTCMCDSFVGNCPTGTAVGADGNCYGSCVACPAGTFGTGGSTICQKCAAGTYNSGTGKTSCTTCPAGTNTSFPGAKSSSFCFLSSSSGY